MCQLNRDRQQCMRYIVAVRNVSPTLWSSAIYRLHRDSQQCVSYIVVVSSMLNISTMLQVTHLGWVLADKPKTLTSDP